MKPKINHILVNNYNCLKFLFLFFFCGKTVNIADLLIGILLNLDFYEKCKLYQCAKICMYII